MSNNYVCPFCSTRYDFNPGRCGCGEAVMFDGLGDRQRWDRAERERKARAEHREREEAAAAAARAKEKAASETRTQARSAKPDGGRTQDSPFSGKLAVLGFLVGSIWAYNKAGHDLIVAGIAGLIGAGILGKFGKAIIGFCAAILLLLLLLYLFGKRAS